MTGLVLVRTGLEQTACHLQLSLLSCNEQRGGAIFEGLVLVRTGLEQKAYNLQLSVLSCDEQRGAAILFGLGPCLCPHWPPAEAVQPPTALSQLRCTKGWRHSPRPCPCPHCLEQKACHLQLSFLSCDVQRGGAILTGLVLVRTGLEQTACHLQLSLLSCNEQRGGAIFEGLVLVRTGLEQKAYNLQLSVLSCDEQRGAAILFGLGPCLCPHWPPAEAVQPPTALSQLRCTKGWRHSPRPCPCPHWPRAEGVQPPTVRSELR